MSPTRLYRWIERRPTGADTLALVFLDDLAEHVVREWQLDELPPAALDGATMVLQLAQDDVDEREEAAARYALRWQAQRSTLAQTIIKCGARAELSAELAEVGKQPEPQVSAQSIASEFIGQILRHKETESRQYFAGMQSVIRAQAEVITQLREHVRELREDLRKADAQAGMPEAATPNPEAEARAVATDKLVDMVITHLGPKLPSYVDRIIQPPPIKRIG
jgi:hypothetical protein